MAFSLFKKKAYKELYAGILGHLAHQHKVDYATLYDDMRCVERSGTVDGQGKVTLLRVFSLKQVTEKDVTVTGWETFDEHPELILFEGYYVFDTNKALLERKTHVGK